jgi:hypothetical protein
MKNKSKQIIKLNSQLKTILIDEIKKSIKKKRKNKSIRLIHNLSQEVGTTQ